MNKDNSRDYASHNILKEFFVISIFCLAIIIPIVYLIYIPDDNNIWKVEWGKKNVTEKYIGTVCDQSGNIIITGNRINDIFLLKYSRNGILEWEKTWNSKNNTNPEIYRDYCYDICLDSENNIYITGYSFNKQLLILKYNSKGDLIKTILYGNNIVGKGIAVSSSLNIYVVGKIFNNTLKKYEGFIVKFNNNGTVMWNITFKEYFEIRRITIDNFNNIYVITKEKTKLILIKLNSEGDIIWKTFWDGDPNEEDLKYNIEPNILKINDNDDLIISGKVYSYTKDYLINFDSSLFLIAYNNKGKKLWHYFFNKYYSNSSICIDNKNNVYFGGSKKNCINIYNSKGIFVRSLLIKNEISIKDMVINNKNEIFIFGMYKESNDFSSPLNLRIIHFSLDNSQTILFNLFFLYFLLIFINLFFGLSLIKIKINKYFLIGIILIIIFLILYIPEILQKKIFEIYYFFDSLLIITLIFIPFLILFYGILTQLRNLIYNEKFIIEKSRKQKRINSLYELFYNNVDHNEILLYENKIPEKLTLFDEKTNKYNQFIPIIILVINFTFILLGYFIDVFFYEIITEYIILILLFSFFSYPLFLFSSQDLYNINKVFITNKKTYLIYDDSISPEIKIIDNDNIQFVHIKEDYKINLFAMYIFQKYKLYNESEIIFGFSDFQNNQLLIESIYFNLNEIEKKWKEIINERNDKDHFIFYLDKELIKKNRLIGKIIDITLIIIIIVGLSYVYFNFSELTSNYDNFSLFEIFFFGMLSFITFWITWISLANQWLIKGKKIDNSLILEKNRIILKNQRKNKIIKIIKLDSKISLMKKDMKCITLNNKDEYVSTLIILKDSNMKNWIKFGPVSKFDDFFETIIAYILLWKVKNGYLLNKEQIFKNKKNINSLIKESEFTFEIDKIKEIVSKCKPIKIDNISYEIIKFLLEPEEKIYYFHKNLTTRIKKPQKIFITNKKIIIESNLSLKQIPFSHIFSIYKYKSRNLEKYSLEIWLKIGQKYRKEYEKNPLLYSDISLKIRNIPNENKMYEFIKYSIENLRDKDFDKNN
ncbi:MAG: hypothetical protein ACTSRP_19975 [Candidatus Helarchaeota archaeon]